MAPTDRQTGFEFFFLRGRRAREKERNFIPLRDFIVGDNVIDVVIIVVIFITTESFICDRIFPYDHLVLFV